MFISLSLSNDDTVLSHDDKIIIYNPNGSNFEIANPVTTITMHNSGTGYTSPPIVNLCKKNNHHIIKKGDK